VIAPGEHREVGRYEGKDGTFECQSPVQLGETQVITDAQAHRAEAGVGGHDLGAGLYQRAFTGVYLTLYGHVEHMNLAVLREKFAAWTEEEAGVAHLLGVAALLV